MENATAATTNVYFLLGVDIAMLLLAGLSFVGNSLVFFVIIWRPLLRKNESVSLIAGLSLADSLLGLLHMPYVIYLIVYWNEEFNYSPFIILPLSTPTVCEIKISSIMTLSIALDRLTAVHWPLFYRLRNKRRYAVGSFLLGLLWAIIDGILLFVMSEFKPIPGCAAGGCFLGKKFRSYWSITNMVVNLVVMITTVLLLIKLRIYNKTVTTMHGVEAARIQEEKKFKHANMIAVNVLLVSGVCIFVPNCLAGLGAMFGFEVYSTVGPVASFGLVLSGVCNSFIYGMKHKDIQLAIASLCKSNQVSSTDHHPT